MNEMQLEYETASWHANDKVHYSDGMDFEKIVDNDLEEEDDMNAMDAAFMRGYMEERYQPTLTGR